MSHTSSEFQVKLEGVKFSREAETRIESGIRSLVLQELAGYTPNPDDPGHYHPHPHPHGEGGLPPVIFVPIKWPGLLMHVLDQKQFENIKPILEQTQFGD